MRAILGFISLCVTGLLACGGGVSGFDEPVGDASSDGPSRSDAAIGTIVADGGSSSDAGPGGTTSTLACGSAACVIPGESCCVYESTSPPSYLCVVGATCPAAPSGTDGAISGGGGATALKCSATSNCGPGTVCCVFESGTSAASECRTACAKNEAQLCDPKAPVPGCPASVKCSSNNVTDWGLPETYATCGGVGT